MRHAPTSGMENYGAEEFIEVNDAEVDLAEGTDDYEKIARLRALQWEQAKWKRSGAWLFNGPNGAGKTKGTIDQPLEEDALVNLGLQPGTELQFDETGWDKDLCTICSQELYETNDELYGQGWRSEDTWICGECYRLFVSPEAVFSGRFPAELDI